MVARKLALPPSAHVASDPEQAHSKRQKKAEATTSSAGGAKRTSLTRLHALALEYSKLPEA